MLEWLLIVGGGLSTAVVYWVYQSGSLRWDSLENIYGGMGGSKNRATPKWVVYMENPIKMDDLGVPPFKETSVSSTSNYINQTNLSTLGKTTPPLSYGYIMYLLRRIPELQEFFEKETYPLQ